MAFATRRNKAVESDRYRQVALQRTVAATFYHDLRNIALLQSTLFAISATLTKADAHFNNDSETGFAARGRLNHQNLTAELRQH